jgi:hypothetical protein
VVALWLFLHDYIPKSLQEASGRIQQLYELGGILGRGAMLGALTFVAYLLGSIVRKRPPSDYDYVVSAPLWVEYATSWAMATGKRRASTWLVNYTRETVYNRGYRLRLQLETFVATRLRESASSIVILTTIFFVMTSTKSERFAAKKILPRRLGGGFVGCRKFLEKSKIRSR